MPESLPRLAVVTSSRADFCHLHWPLVEFEASPHFDVELIAFGPHLASEFGVTSKEIERAGHRIAHTLSSLEERDDDVGMARSLARATDEISRLWESDRPDAVLVIADRYEMLAPATVATTLRVPVIHIEGGEDSFGAIDQQVRNALTQLATLHFTSTETARARVISFGANPIRVHAVGAPSLDHWTRSELPSRSAILALAGVDGRRPMVIASMHPVTHDLDPVMESRAFFDALEELAVDDIDFVCLHPNADAGGREIASRFREFANRHANVRFIVNLAPLDYWGLLRESRLIVGNSSSGVMESGTRPLRAVDVGRRQEGRERGGHVETVPADRRAIVEACRRALESPLDQNSAATNLYGDGHAAPRMRSAIEEWFGSLAR